VTAPAPPVTWPDGRRAAACFTFDVDGESAVLSTHPQAASRMSVMSHQAYGPLVGVPRLLDLLERHSVRATFFVPGFTAHRYPDVVRAIAAAGHEIGHHGYLHEPLIDVEPDAEAAILDRGLDALAEVAGVRPAGYRAPMWELTFHSPALLHERGFQYDSSLMDADHPYLLDVGDGRRTLVEIPVHWALDDWEQYCYIPDIAGTGLMRAPDDMLRTWTAELDAMTDAGGCFVLTNHPFLTGRPARARALDQLIRHAAGRPDLWVTTLADVAAHIASLPDPRPRTITRPDPGAPR